MYVPLLIRVNQVSSEAHDEATLQHPCKRSERRYLLIKCIDRLADGCLVGRQARRWLSVGGQRATSLHL